MDFTMVNTDELYYRRTMTVMMRDCDIYRRLKPTAVLELFQECSERLTENWGVGLDLMLDNGLIWVAARVGCRVNRLPVHNEVITLIGQCARGGMGMFPYRYTVEAQDGETLIEGSSVWVLSDVREHTMLSSRVPALKLPTPDGPDAPRVRLAPIRPAKEFETGSRRVRYSECDINGHLTNNRYMDWLCDLAPKEFHRDHPMKGLRINYMSECFPDEDIPLQWQVSDERIWCAGPKRFDAEITFR